MSTVMFGHLVFCLVPAGSHEETGAGEDLAQVHRHQQQVRSRSVPDPPGQGVLHGSPQEGQEGVMCHGLLAVMFIYCLLYNYVTSNKA